MKKKGVGVVSKKAAGWNNIFHPVFFFFPAPSKQGRGVGVFDSIVKKDIYI